VVVTRENLRSFAAPLQIVGACLALGFLVAGCRDVLQPRALPIDDILGSYVPDASQETPDGVTWTVPSDQASGSLPARSSPLRNIKHGTVVEVEFRSSITGYPNVIPGPPGLNLGIRGDYNCYTQAANLTFGSNVWTIWNACTTRPQITPNGATVWVDTVGIKGDVGLGRNSRAASAATGCGNANEPPCYTWVASEATATIRVLDVELKIGATPTYSGSKAVKLDDETILLTGTNIEFQAYNDPYTLKGMGTEVWVQHYDAMEFRSFDGTLVKKCNWWSHGGRCQMWGMTKSGTMKITALSNGKWKTKTVRVIVNRDFKVTPSPPDTLVGGTVKFTATVDGQEVPVGHWWWDGPGSSSAMMTANSTALRASDCPVGTPECEKVMEAVGTGKMTARLASGDSAWADAAARDTTCWTDDDVLDDPVVRHSLLDLWSRADPENLDTWNRREQNATVFDSANVTEVWIFSAGANTACTSTFNHVTRPGWTRIADIHVHPRDPYELYACTSSDYGDVDGYYWGGLSPGDVRTALVNKGNAAYRGFYILDKRNILRFRPTYPSPTDDQYWYNHLRKDGSIERAPDPQLIRDSLFYWALPRAHCKLY
jgi:hypothetical protein